MFSSTKNVRVDQIQGYKNDKKAKRSIKLSSRYAICKHRSRQYAKETSKYKNQHKEDICLQNSDDPENPKKKPEL